MIRNVDNEEFIETRLNQEASENDCYHRVMSRFHIDLITPNRSGKPFRKNHPAFHLQIGGNAQQHEISWFHKKITEPRIPCFPFDIILAIEFVLHNFYSTHCSELFEESTWKRIIKESEQMMMVKYLTFLSECLTKDDSDKTILEKLHGKTDDESHYELEELISDFVRL